MIFPIQRVLFGLCVSIFILCFGSVAYDIEEAKLPQGPLGITLDRSLALSWPKERPASQQVARNWMWSSLLIFVEPVSHITDGQLWKMVTDAYEEMTQDRIQYGIRMY